MQPRDYESPAAEEMLVRVGGKLRERYLKAESVADAAAARAAVLSHLVVVEVEPRGEVQDAEEKPIEPFRFEHCAMRKLVGGKACNERIDRAVGGERQG
jgi:hypothetical protein